MGLYATQACPDQFQRLAINRPKPCLIRLPL